MASGVVDVVSSRSTGNSSSCLQKKAANHLNKIVKNVPAEECKNLSMESQNRNHVCAAVCTVGKNVLQALFRTFYFHPENSNSNRGSASFTEWKYNVRKSQKKLKDIFGSRFKYPHDMKGEFDLGTCFLFITKMDEDFCKKMFCSECRSRMEAVKVFKNKVLHNEPLQETECSLDNLLSLFTELLECAARDLNDKTYIEPVLQDLPRQVKRQGNCGEALHLIATAPSDSFVKMSRSEIRKKGISRIFAIPFYWIMDDFSGESELAMKGNKLFENVAMDVFTNPFVECNSFRFESRDLLVHKIRDPDNPQVILIQGHGGCGKTTLCHHIFSKWQDKDDKHDLFYQKLDSVDLVVFIEMHSAKSKSLLNYLRNEYVQESVSVIKEKELLKFLRSLNVLFIVDGFDERNSVNVNLVCDIAEHLSCSSNRIILTTRPECLSEARSIFSRIPKTSILLVDMVGFDKAGRENFSSKILSQKQVKLIYPTAVPEDFCTFLSEQDKTLSPYLKFPLTITLILLLWLQTKSRKRKTINFCTATHLYRELFKMLIEKLVGARMYAGLQGKNINTRSVKAVLDVLSQSAKSAIFVDDFQIEIPSSEVEKISQCCKEYDVNFIEFMSAFTQFLSDPSMKSEQPQFLSDPSMKSEQSQFSFFHRTEMEYLSADSFAKTLICSQSLPMRSFEDVHKFYEVLPFLVGILSAMNKLDENDSKIIEHLKNMQVPCGELNFFSKLITESTTCSKHGTPCKKRFCSLLCELMPRTIWKLDASTVLSGLHLLQHCPCINLFELIINLPLGCDPDKLPGLHERLTELRDAVRRRCLSFQVAVTFCIEKHYECEGSLSDSYLPCIMEWAKLVKFTGAISPKGVEHLTNFLSVNCLRLRITSSTTFNDFARKIFPKCTKLKQMDLILDFPMNVQLQLCRLKCSGARKPLVRLRLDRILRKDLRGVLHVIKSIRTESMGMFDWITIKSFDLDYNQNAYTIVEALKDHVYSKLAVSSGNQSIPPHAIKDKDSIFQWNGQCYSFPTKKR